MGAHVYTANTKSREKENRVVGGVFVVVVVCWLVGWLVGLLLLLFWGRG